MKKVISYLLAITIIASMFSCLQITVFAASSYYFDSVNGNDNVLSNSKTKPYKSLSKLNSKSFSSGSTVYINGEVFTEGSLSHSPV